jgi:hypothetical protein
LDARTIFNVVLVESRHSGCLAELAEYLTCSLNDAGFPTSCSGQLSESNRNILLNSHVLRPEVFSTLPSDSIILNTEPLVVAPTSHYWQQHYPVLLSKFQVWDLAQANVEYLLSLGCHASKLGIGYHKVLHRIPRSDPQDIDVLFYGSHTMERRQLRETLSRGGLVVRFLFGVYGAARDSYISRAKLVLNLHQHPNRQMEVARLHYLMNNAKAIVSQFEADTLPETNYLDGLCLAKLEHIPDLCHEMLSSFSCLREAEDRSLDAIRRVDATAEARALVASLSD